MQSVSSQIASRSELLELVETLGFYSQFEQRKVNRVKEKTTARIDESRFGQPQLLFQGLIKYGQDR